MRARAGADPFGPFAAYCAARLAKDPHLWATTLFDEVTGLGFDRSYPTFTRQLRARGLRPQLRAVPSGERSGGGGDRAPAR